MYYMEPLPNGSKLRRLVRKWSYHTSEIPKRAYSKMTGYSYQPSLRWDEQGPRRVSTEKRWKSLYSLSLLREM